MTNWPEKLKDKWWRLNNLYKIKTKAGNLETFHPNYIQLKHLVERKSHRYNLILKARQFGFTTLYCIDYLDEALWTPGMSCAILAHEREAADKIFEIVKRAYVNIPDMLKPITKTDTKRMYQFTNKFDGSVLDSWIYVALKIRAGTVLKLHITESSRIKDRAELAAGSKQAVPIEGCITEETTGNGFEGFYDQYMHYFQKKDLSELDYKTYFYAWFENPEYSLDGTIIDKTEKELSLQNTYSLTDGQLLWRRWKMVDLKQKQEGAGLTGEQLFMQEYPSNVLEAFQSGAGSVFDQEKVSRVIPMGGLGKEECLIKITNVDEKERFKRLYLNEVTFWEMPEYGKKYVIGIDPSDGEGSDNGCIDVWEKESLRQVAQFYGKMRPDELAQLASEIGWFYNEAFIGVENNMLTTILFLSKIYSNYYYETRIDERTLKRTRKIGWSTNVKTRDVMIDEYNILFDEGHLTIRSRTTLSEMRTFVKNPDNGKREHAVGKHDDSLFAAFIAIQMRKHSEPRARAFTTKPF